MSLSPLVMGPGVMTEGVCRGICAGASGIWHLVPSQRGLLSCSWWTLVWEGILLWEEGLGYSQKQGFTVNWERPRERQSCWGVSPSVLAASEVRELPPAAVAQVTGLHFRQHITKSL